MLIELTVAAPISFLEFDRSSDVEVSQTDEGDENGEDELKEVPEPNDVVRIHAKLCCVDYIFSHIGLQR